MDKPHYHGHRERLKQRLAREPRSLADYEVLELLLGMTIQRQDTKPLGKALLERFETLSGVLYAPEEQLLEVSGFGPALASSWRLLREFAARLGEDNVRNGAVITGPAMVAEGAKARFGSSRVEEFWVALVDNRNRIMGWEPVAKGTVDQTAVYPREVLQLALKHRASGLIMVHNHPGGDPTPSEADRMLTVRMVRAGTELGVRVLDHLVVTDSDFYSFQDHGLI